MRFVILVLAIVILIGGIFYFRNPPVSSGDKALTAVAKSQLCLKAQAAYLAAGDTSEPPECDYLNEND